MIMGKWEKSCQKKIILDQVFERPPEVSQSEIEGGGGGEVFLEEEIVHTNVQRLKSQVSVGFFFGGGVQSPLLGITGMFGKILRVMSETAVVDMG